MGPQLIWRWRAFRSVLGFQAWPSHSPLLGLGSFSIK